MKYILAISITVFFYLTGWTYGEFYWFEKSVWEWVYCLVMVRYCNIKTLPAILVLEILACMSILIACVQYKMAQKTGFFYSHFEDIMGAIFILELLVIMGEVIYGYIRGHFDFYTGARDKYHSRRRDCNSTKGYI